jgi:hypothetical protein
MSRSQPEKCGRKLITVRGKPLTVFWVLPEKLKPN